ncbi:MAG: c-type cytochrome [bacterium]
MKKLSLVLLASSFALVSGAAMAADGEATYKQACFACHGTGAAGAPKIGDKAAWAPRIAEGNEVMYNIALHGKPGTAMVAKGGQAQLSDEAVKAAVDYMVSKSK